MKCENSTPGSFIAPSCRNSDAVFAVDIIDGNDLYDTLYLCKDCSDAIKNHAENRGYKVERVTVKERRLVDKK